MKEDAWNEAAHTWRLASYLPPTERRGQDRERRSDPRRAALGERRTSNRRSLRSLFRL